MVDKPDFEEGRFDPNGYEEVAEVEVRFGRYEFIRLQNSRQQVVMYQYGQVVPAS
jgi:hypothetical protein